MYTFNTLDLEANTNIAVLISTVFQKCVKSAE